MDFPGGIAARKLVPGGFTASQTAAASGALSFDLNAGAAGDFFSGLWDLVKAKFAEAAAYLAALLAAVAGKVDEAFPPETRSETLRQWVHVAVTVVLPVVLAALLLCCCCRCCCGAGRGACGGGGRRFMAAPGRGGARMPRGAFESNPRLYFRDLRAGKPLVY